MSNELIENLRAHAASFMGGDGGLRDTMLRAADALEAKAAPVGEREAFEAWLGIKPCGAAHDLALVAFKAGAAYQRAQQPQPSAGVVMPERQSPEDEWRYVMRERSHGWNACLDEFARLNGKEVGRG